MISKNFIKRIIKLCNLENITDVEVYYKNSKSILVNVVKDEIETFKFSDDEGINISGNFDGKHNETYIEKFDEQAIAEGIKYIKDTATFNCKKSKKSCLHQLDNQKENPEPNDTNIDLVIEKLKEIQGKASNADERITSIPTCSYYENRTTIELFNDGGVELEDTYNYVVATLSVIAEENGIMKNGYASTISKDFSNIDYNIILEDAVCEATSMMNAKPIKTGNYKVILRNNVVSEIFSYLLSVFYIDSIEKGTSNLKDKKDTQIAVTSLNLIEDPYYDNAAFNRTFDDEGTRTYKKYLIQNGVLKNILTKSSNKPVELTGNAFRNSYKGNISISARNCYIEKGSTTTEQMILETDECMMITNIDGLHAGISVVTGDFSLISNGYYYKNGKKVQAVDQITVSGNFYELLNNIIDISSDVASSINEDSFFESPSLLVEGLMIGGL